MTLGAHVILYSRDSDADRAFLRTCWTCSTSTPVEGG
jgi:hypothetical protein